MREAMLLVMMAALATAQGPGEWRDILPGAELKGWTRVAVPPEKPLGEVSQWKMDTARRVLVCEGNGGHEWLRWDREIGNAVFHLEWRFAVITAGKNYNSGIYIRNSADGRLWHQGQIGSADGGYVFGSTIVAGAPQRFNLIKAMTEQRIRPAGEWNVSELGAEGRRITFRNNGGVTSEFSECDVPRGYLGVEAEGYRIEFRNLRLKLLP
jgi:hypothetical protein